MLEIIRDVFVAIFLLGGLFFYFVGVVGLIRMPDVFCRMHATTKCDTMGAGLMFIGMMIWQGATFVSLNILIIIVFIWLTNPTAAHYIAKCEYINRHLTVDENK
ncbi:monovalent cation/H(+) antiporter subunit G [Peloplasma aerotolerans]|jgi:multicomponent Na+:H+ antiporter subunit G|uniref:Monovalent cation/H(+) antiporter subunit G n=1 Tax=Peloplasma aerotolerans TaxID=3044389 RepID=A0AAW6U5U0_9MOLU|nr:monovalent cation/H(+) antiporter subunit G [Mariniplasma sp. M4Ah]MCR3905976.1 monovalent cation/H(+) antiporter subunit G [Mycoplasmatota bacterium]MDI6453272.1 monovalent cation/H(+) antiporter subunit G [Mariniplasma sp. M4Ah]MDR4968826.1 monovalent cation/H(+) antiporter subunit G [Acholeplasmataceae bacterium]